MLPSHYDQRITSAALVEREEREAATLKEGEGGRHADGGRGRPHHHIVRGAPPSDPTAPPPDPPPPLAPPSDLVGGGSRVEES